MHVLLYYIRAAPAALTYLKAGGDRGKLIVCSFSVSYQVIPAGEHLPVKIEAVVISNAGLICITCHPYMYITNNIQYTDMDLKALSAALTDLRPNYHHVAVGHCAHTNQEV